VVVPTNTLLPSCAGVAKRVGVDPSAIEPIFLPAPLIASRLDPATVYSAPWPATGELVTPGMRQTRLKCPVELTSTRLSPSVHGRYTVLPVTADTPKAEQRGPLETWPPMPPRCEALSTYPVPDLPACRM
jgi:hypothetical protein